MKWDQKYTKLNTFTYFKNDLENRVDWLFKMFCGELKYHLIWIWSTKVDMIYLSPVRYGVQLTFRALAFRRNRLSLETSAKHHIPTGDKHIISTFVDQTHIQRTRPRRKTVFFKTSLRV